MLNLNKLNATFPWPVDIPVASNGEMQKCRIGMDFRRFTREELDELRQIALDQSIPREVIGDLGPNTAILERDTDYVMKVATGWRDVDVGGSTEFNRENVRRLLNAIVPAGGAIVAAFWQATNGEAAEKNS